MSIEEEVELLLSAYTEDEVIVDRTSDGSTSVHYHYEGDEITFILPDTYPETCISSISISCRDLGKATALRLKLELLDRSKRSTGEPSLFNIISDYVNIRSNIIEQLQHESAAPTAGDVNYGTDNIFKINASSPAVEIKSTISRCLIHFHHIMADGKKAFIKEEAEVLDLGGVWCSGFPGCIVVEGRKENVDIYVKGLKGLRWQVRVSPSFSLLKA